MVAQAIHELVGFSTCLTETLSHPAHHVPVSAALEVNYVHLVCKEVTDVTGLNLDKLFTFYDVDVLSKVLSELFYNELSGFLVLFGNLTHVLIGSG